MQRKTIFYPLLAIIITAVILFTSACGTTTATIATTAGKPSGEQTITLNLAG